ncbi:MAG: HEPN domain-containing protein [Oscillospiraceae bacterium]|nr:HEPN domain-containing protein [Oscillospiraceae bacterium]
MFNEKEIKMAKIEIQTSLEDYETAEENFKNNRYRVALNRAYYSIFHMMCARLDLEGLGFSKHSAVIAKFRELYLNKDFDGDLKKKLSDIITTSEDLRNESDYQKGFATDADTVEKSIEKAKFFNDTLLEHINNLISKNQE